jgi:hypothetical protein
MIDWREHLHIRRRVESMAFPDNGPDFDPGGILPSPYGGASGLKKMRERAETAAGTFSLEWSSRKCTRIEVCRSAESKLFHPEKKNPCPAEGRNGTMSAEEGRKGVSHDSFIAERSERLNQVNSVYGRKKHPMCTSVLRFGAPGIDCTQREACVSREMFTRIILKLPRGRTRAWK